MLRRTPSGAEIALVWNATLEIELIRQALRCRHVVGRRCGGKFYPESVGCAVGPKIGALLQRPSEITRTAPNAVVGREGGAGKTFPTGISGNPIVADLDFEPADPITTWRSAGPGHRIGGEQHPVARFGPDQIAQDERRQVDAVGNEAGRQLVARQESLGNVCLLYTSDAADE